MPWDRGKTRRPNPDELKCLTPHRARHPDESGPMGKGALQQNSPQPTKTATESNLGCRLNFWQVGTGSPHDARAECPGESLRENLPVIVGLGGNLFVALNPIDY